MSVTTYQGIVERGRIKLAGNIRLPEKATVFVIMPDFADDPENKRTVRFNLAELVARMPAGYQVEEVDFGNPEQVLLWLSKSSLLITTREKSSLSKRRRPSWLRM